MTSLVIALPGGGGGPQNANGPPLVAPRWRRRSDECAFPLLGIGVQAIQLSPYHAGLAGQHLWRLPASPASRACSVPLWLSPSGEPDGPETFLRVPPGCARDSAPRSAAHDFRASGSPVSGSPDEGCIAHPSDLHPCRTFHLSPFVVSWALPQALGYYGDSVALGITAGRRSRGCLSGPFHV